MRTNQGNITFRIYHQERVKYPSVFFGALVYPLFIRIHCRTKALSFKSHCFGQLLNTKYQNSVHLGNKAPLISEVIRLETSITQFLISRHQYNFSADYFKTDYDHCTVNLLDMLDEAYKQYMVNFFFEEGMPSIAYLLESLRTKLTADIILQDLKRSLSKPVYNKLTGTDRSLALPYIPLIEYSKLHCSGTMGLLAYHFYQENFRTELDTFIGARYPGYNLHPPYAFLCGYLKSMEESKDAGS